MSETSAVTAAQPAESVIERALRAQPIWLRETRQASRLLRTPWILFALTVIVTLGLSAFGAVAVSDHVTPSNIGTMVFHVFFSIAYVVVVLAGSAIAANAIAVEREGKTFEALQLTGLGPRQVARQKFASAYTQLAQYIFALAPVGALSFLFGGVTTTEVVIAYVMLFAVGALSVGFGLALSSLMPNLRAALLSTVAVSVIAGPALWGFFGFGGSAVAHHLWHDIPEAHPIWMPLAYTRAPFGAKYVVLLFAAPAVVFGVPGWLMYEITVANLSSDADDRSTGYKRWFLASSAICAALVLAVAALGESSRERVEIGTAGVGLLTLLLGFGAFLLSGDPLAPSRRVQSAWERTAATGFTRLLGPGLSTTSVLSALWGVAIVGGTAALVCVEGMASSAYGNGGTTAAERLLVFVCYAGAFFVFLVGFLGALRARGMRVIVARALGAGVLVLLCTVPWVAAAIGAVASGGGEKGALVLAAPSPLYAFVMMSEIHSYSYSTHGGTLVGGGVLATLLWLVLGVSLLGYVRARRP